MIIAQAQTPTSTFWVSPGVYPTDTFTVWNEGSNYYCKNARGQLVYAADHTNASYVINSALAGLTVGRTWQETVRVRGAFTITHTLEVAGYTKLILDCNITLADNRNVTMLTNANHATGDWYIDIEGGTLNGNQAGQTTTGYGILFNNTQRWNIRDTRILYCESDGIRLDGTAGLLNGVGNIESCYIFENQGSGIHLEVYTGDCKINDNDVGGNAQSGIELESGAGANTICNNLVWNNGNTSTGYNGIYVYDADANTIEGNRVDYNGAGGINVFGDWNTISDNTVYCNSYRTGYSGSYDGIRLYNSTNCTITGGSSFNSGGSYQGWGVSEAGSSDYNSIIGISCFENAVGGITTVGANTEVLGCFNGTTWIGGTAGPAGPAGTTEARQPYDYLVFRNATATYMINGVTGAIDDSGTPSNVINNAVGNGTDVLLFSNTFQLTAETGIDLDVANTVLRGSGHNTIITCESDLDDHIIDISASGCKVKNLKIDGGDIQDVAYDGIYVGATTTWIEDVNIEDCGRDGIRVGDPAGGHWYAGKISHVRISSNGEYGLYMTYDATDWEVHSFLINSHTGTGDAGIRLEGSNNRFTNGHLWGNYYELIVAEAESVRGALFSNVIFADGGQGTEDGTHRVYHTSANSFRDSTFVGCEFWSCYLAGSPGTYSGMYLDGTTYGVSITGCIFRGADQDDTLKEGLYGIFLDASSHNITIVANVFHFFSAADPIQTTGASDIDEGHNIILDCG